MRQAKEIADYFVHKGIQSHQPVTAMVLEKLLFFSHGLMLLEHNTPLVFERFVVKPWGPSIEGLFEHYASWGADPILRCLDAKYIKRVQGTKISTNQPKTLDKILDEYWEDFSGYTDKDFVKVLIQSQSPWYKLLKDTQDPLDRPIKNEDILKYMSKLFGSNDSTPKTDPHEQTVM